MKLVAWQGKADNRVQVSRFLLGRGTSALSSERKIRLRLQQELRSEAMEDRITHLESKLCLTEDLVDELNRTVYRQQQQLDQLQAQIRLLYQQMQNSNSASIERRDLREEIPPHY